MPKRLKWTVTYTYDDGKPRDRRADLIYGCKLELADIPALDEQKSVLTLNAKGINYQKSFSRKRPEDCTEEESRDWAEQCAYGHLRLLEALAQSAGSSFPRHITTESRWTT